MISFAQHVANVESELQKTQSLAELRRLAMAARSAVATTPMTNTDDGATWARLREVDAFIAAGGQVVGVCHRIMDCLKSLRGSPHRSMVLSRLALLRTDLKRYAGELERLCASPASGFGDWIALDSWRRLICLLEGRLVGLLGPNKSEFV